MTITDLIKSIAAKPGGKSLIQKARGRAKAPKNAHRDIPVLLEYARQIDEVLKAAWIEIEIKIK